MRVIQIPLGKSAIFALVDEADADSVAPHKWFASHRRGAFSSRTYAIRAGNRDLGETRTVYMHRSILNASAGQYVDHIDNNGLNNRRSNIRIISAASNTQRRPYHRPNKNGFPGVSMVDGFFYGRVSRGRRSFYTSKCSDPESAYFLMVKLRAEVSNQDAILCLHPEDSYPC